MDAATTIDPVDLALRALVWTLGEQSRADRLLALTGLDADAMRAGIGNPAVLGGVLAFLESHEPDLIACAADIGSTPIALLNAKASLDQ